MNDDDLAYVAIMRLQRAYADASTRKAWPEFAALATADARFSFDTRTGTIFEMVGLEAFVEFAAKMTAGFSFYEYVPLNFVVETHPDGTARGRSYSFEIGQVRDTGELTSFYGWYQDEYARVDGAWRFTRRRYETLGRRTGGDPMQSFPLIDRPL
ncbi:MAG: nuclear transport factor 2 family protein [Acidimicrobiales bacterium]